VVAQHMHIALSKQIKPNFSRLLSLSTTFSVSRSLRHIINSAQVFGFLDRQQSIRLIILTVSSTSFLHRPNRY
jgi:hypothetical protein